MSRQIMTPERIAEFRDAIANHPNFGIGGDALSKILDALEAAQAEIADLKRGGVVVPELTEEDLVRAGRPYCINDREPFERGARWAEAFIRKSARTIPADRELMRLVDELIRWHGLRPLDKRPDHAAALVGAIKALRTQPTQEPTP